MAMDSAQTQSGDRPEASLDQPMKAHPDQVAAKKGITETAKKALQKVRQAYKDQYAPKRQKFLTRARTSFDFLKNQPYVENPNGAGDSVDTIDAILNGDNPNVMSAGLYRANDNVFQMLALAFIACLSPEVPKARFQPDDADDEEDLMIAAKASDIQADNERRNNIRAMQKRELLYLWCTGSYFCYTRNIVDGNRAGTKKRDILALQQIEIQPPRYICSACGTVTPEDDLSAYSTDLACPACGTTLRPADFHEAYTATVPVKTGEQEVPNSMTAMNVFSGLNVDADPDADKLYESAILDLEGETSIAAVRAAYPEIFKAIQATSATSGAGGTTAAGDARSARSMVTTPGSGNVTSTNQGTFSRCWIQPWAFHILDDQKERDELLQLFPDGVKYVSYDNGNVFLQAIAEPMMQKWTWCGTIEGMGLYPFGVGDAALDLQRRVNNAANTVDAYMDRLAFGTLLYDADIIDWDAISSRPLMPGNGTPVNRKSDDGIEKSLEQLIYQPEFRIDSKIFEYGDDLIQLMQVIAGVQPQSFGGSDPNVKTKGGQEQALQTALGRMKLYWDQIREEHASRAENSVKCTVRNMDEQHRIVKGDGEDGWETISLLRSELTGDFKAYVESDEGFPASYSEIQSRIMELMGHIKDNPFLGAVLSDPDTRKAVARYILPDPIKLPDDADRKRLKLLCKTLSEGAPIEGSPGPDGTPVLLPSQALNQEFDNVPMATVIAKQFLVANADMLNTNPDGFNNVLALLRQANMLMRISVAKQQLTKEAADQGGGDGGDKDGEGGPGDALPAAE